MQQKDDFKPSTSPIAAEFSAPVPLGNFSISLTEPLWGPPDSPVQKPQPENPEFWTLFLCLRGKGRLEIGGQTHSIQHGSVWFTTRSRQARWIEFDRPEMSLLQLSFSVQRVRSDADDLSTRAISDLLAGRTDPIGHDPGLCEYSSFLKGRVGSSKRPGLQGVLIGFLIDCVFALIEGSKLLSDRDKIRVYVADHARQKITVPDLAKLLSVSERSLFYFFSKNFQTSPNDFINRTRMASAAECLKKGISVKEVSEMYRFSESTSFCRMFKKYFGVTPSEYQRLALTGTDTPTIYGGGYIDACPPNP